MLIVYLAIAVLAIAMCVLAAMVGELAGRVLSPAELRRPVEMPTLTAIEEVSRDAWVATVPPLLGSTAAEPLAAPADLGLVVLTTVCESCHAFARTLGASPKADRLPEPLFILISAPKRADAERFAVETGLRRVPKATVLFDELGQWCHQTLGLNRAPSFVRVVDARVRGAWTLSSFTDIPGLWESAVTVPSATVPSGTVPSATVPSGTAPDPN